MWGSDRLLVASSPMECFSQAWKPSRIVITTQNTGNGFKAVYTTGKPEKNLKSNISTLTMSHNQLVNIAQTRLLLSHTDNSNLNSVNFIACFSKYKCCLLSILKPCIVAIACKMFLLIDVSCHNRRHFTNCFYNPERERERERERYGTP